MSFAGTDKINDREVYVLRGATADNKRHRLYFDRETGWLLRRVITTPTVLANIPEQIDFENYREVDGMKLPFTIRITSIDRFVLQLNAHVHRDQTECWGRCHEIQKASSSNSQAIEIATR